MRVVVALPSTVEDALLAPLMAARHEIIARPAGSAELESVIAGLRPDAVLVHAVPRLLDATVVDAADRMGTRVIAFASLPAELSHVAELGLHEVSTMNASWEEVSALLVGDAIIPDAVADTRPAGRVVTVWGPTGAPGRTTTAVGIAVEMVRAGRRVALVDADSYGGAVAPALGLLDEAPGFAAACRLAGSDGLDLAQLDRIGIPVPVPGGRLAVLTGLTRPSRWTELSADRVGLALDVMRDWVDVIVVDAGFSLESDEEIMSDVLAPRRNAATMTALERADRVVAVGSADAVSLARLLRGHAELLDIVPAERVDVVVNRLRRSSVGFDARGQITNALTRFGGVVPDAILPFDPAGCDAALVQAKPLAAAAPRSSLRHALAKYVQGTLLPSLEPTVAARPEAMSEPKRRRRALALR